VLAWLTHAEARHREVEVVEAHDLHGVTLTRILARPESDPSRLVQPPGQSLVMRQRGPPRLLRSCHTPTSATDTTLAGSGAVRR